MAGIQCDALYKRHNVCLPLLCITSNVAAYQGIGLTCRANSIVAQGRAIFPSSALGFQL
jgi:hypothetical protein